MVTEISHTGIVVKNMEEMVSFYREAFGFEVVLDASVPPGEGTDGIVDFEVAHERIVMMQLSAQRLSLLNYFRWCSLRHRMFTS